LDDLQSELHQIRVGLTVMIRELSKERDTWQHIALEALNGDKLCSLQAQLNEFKRWYDRLEEENYNLREERQIVDAEDWNMY
jgi:hypothetical protein